MKKLPEKRMKISTVVLNATSGAGILKALANPVMITTNVTHDSKFCVL